MSEEKEEKLEAVREQNQQIRDLGEAMLEENEKKYSYPAFDHYRRGGRT